MKLVLFIFILFVINVSEAKESKGIGREIAEEVGGLIGRTLTKTYTHQEIETLIINGFKKSAKQTNPSLPIMVDDTTRLGACPRIGNLLQMA